MRQKLREVKDAAQIEQLLAAGRVGRLATLGADGFPYITPLNYVYMNGAVYFHCALKGERLDNIARDNRVCFEIDNPVAYVDTGFAPDGPVCDVGQLFQSVVIRGRAELVADMEEKLAALNLLTTLFESDLRRPDFPEITAETKAVHLCAVVAVRVESLSCKANLLQSKSEEQKANLRRYLEKRDRPGDRDAAKLIV